MSFYLFRLYLTASKNLDLGRTDEKVISPARGEGATNRRQVVGLSAESGI